MHFSTITALATAILVGTGAALQVNWYSDDNCGNYIDTTYFSGKGIHGNYQGAGSALFVTTDGCPVYVCSSPTGGCVVTKTYQCVAYPDGTYVSSDC